MGAAVVALSLVLLPTGRGAAEGGRLDVAGAVTVTASLMVAVCAIVNGNEAGWTSVQTLGLLAGAVALLALVLGIEARARSPLVPLGLFRLRNVTTANVVGVLMAGGMFAAFFLSARFGTKPPLVAGLSLIAVGIVLFARAPVDGSFAVDVLPGMLLQGLGPAVLASLAASRTDNLLADGEGSLAALTGGYHLGFLVGALFTAGAAALGGALLRARLQATPHGGHEAVGVPATAEAD